jgi:hypothetical protein
MLGAGRPVAGQWQASDRLGDAGGWVMLVMLVMLVTPGAARYRPGWGEVGAASHQKGQKAAAAADIPFVHGAGRAGKEGAGALSWHRVQDALRSIYTSMPPWTVRRAAASHPTSRQRARGEIYAGCQWTKFYTYTDIYIPYILYAVLKGNPASPRPAPSLRDIARISIFL